MCTTTSHYETHISTECSAGGSGICDGYCVDHDNPCSCSCHEAFDLPDTVQGVRDWHDEFNDVVFSVDILNPQGVPSDRAHAWFTAQQHVDNVLAGDGKSYRVFEGQDRAVVQEYYR